MLNEGDIDTEEGAEFFLGDEFAFGAVGEDAAFLHHDDAVDLRQDVGQVVGDHEDAGALVGDAAEGLAEFALGGEVEGVGGFVEEEHFGLVDEGAGDHDAALLAGGHLSDEFRSEVGGLHEVEGLVGAVAHLRRDVEVGPEGGRGEEACGDRVKAAGDRGALTGKFGGDDAEVSTELRDVPALAAKKEQFRGGGDDGVALAGDGFDEGGFATAVGAEDGEVLAAGDAQGDGVEDDVVAAGDADVAHKEEVGGRRWGKPVHPKIMAECRRESRESQPDWQRIVWRG